MTDVLKFISVQFGTCKASYKEPTEHEKENYPAIASRPYSVEALSFGESFSREELVQWQKDINAAISIVLSKTGPEPLTIGTDTVVGKAVTRAGGVYPGAPNTAANPSPYPGDPNVFEKMSTNFSGDVSSPNFLKKKENHDD